MINAGGKKGQFYIITSLIIITMIISYSVVSNYSKKNVYTKVDDLSSNFKAEGEKTLEYAVINGSNSNDLMRDFSKNFNLYSGNDVDIYTIYGIKNSLNSYKYSNGVEEQIIATENGPKASISVDGKNYSFNLLEGENFHYLIKQKIGEEEYVVTN